MSSTRDLRMFRMLAVVAPAVAGIAAATTPLNPSNHDVHPRISFYTSHGVPDPRVEWDADDYYDAVRALMELPADRLPRVSGPAGSRLLFARLLATRSKAPQGIMESARGLSLVRLYRDAHSETSVYDIELVEILNQELRIVLATTMTYEEIESARRDAVKLFEARGSDSRISDLIERLESYDEFFSDSSSRIRSAVESLVLLGADSSISDDGRSRLIEVLKERLPDTRDRLSPKDRSWLADLVEAMSKLPQNTQKEEEMEKLPGIVQ